MIIIVVIIAFSMDDYIRDEQFILLISILIYLNIPVSSPIVDNRIFSTIGSYCFEIYFVHVSLFKILPQLMPSGLQQLLVMTVLTIFISWLLHKYVTLKITPYFVKLMQEHNKKVVLIYIFLLLFSIAVHIHTKYELFIVSEKEGKFAISTVVQSADVSKHSIVIVLPGKYEENIVLDDRDVSLVGLNKKKTIIIDKSGRYNNAPILHMVRFGFTI